MNKNLKLAIMLVAASILGSAATMMATSELQKKGVITDTYVLTKESKATDDGFVQTSSRPVDFSRDFTDVAESTINCVVSIKNLATPKQNYYQGGFIDPFEFFFGPGFGSGNGQGQRKQQQQQKSEPQLIGMGSGVIISTDGYIVTNNHVIEGAEKLEVTLNDNRTFNATVVGSDEKTDIALIKINAKDPHAITFGNSDAIKAGQWCVAVGNPFGFNSTVTAGIISAKAPDKKGDPQWGDKAFIQHDAAVNPGNSGGALVNTAGELIGINTMIYSQTGNYSGCSFAVPSNTVKKVVTDIKQYGIVQRAVLGIQYSELTSEKAKEENITAITEGIYVAKVTDRGAAKEAGLQEGDVIVKLNGSPIKNSGEMQKEMNKLRPGDKAEVEYYRDNKLHRTTVTFKNDQGNTKMTKQSDIMSLGCAFTELSKEDKKDLAISKGLKVVGVKAGKFKNAGIRDGFIITDINNIAVDSRDDVESIYNQIMRSSDTDKVMFITGFYPTGKKVYYAVDLSDEED